MTVVPILSVANLSKKYCRKLRSAMAYGVRDILGELVPALAQSTRLRTDEFWALDDISFDLHPGEALAIIGRNGAGKSTLLKALYGILKPDAGKIMVRGRTEALIELGMGFNSLLSGRENILVGAAIHGLGGAETRRLTDQVVEFAELATSIDAPIQTYSSGMKARLAYALASHLKPDLLLVDEVLAVGDFAFQRKCVSHMRSYLAEGGSLLLVSHNTHQIQSVCERGILLDRGRIIFQGAAVETLNRMFENRLTETPPQSAAVSLTEPLVIQALAVEPVQDEIIRAGEPLRLTLRYDAHERVEVRWGFSVWTSDQWVCIAGETSPDRHVLDPGSGELSCVIPRLPLVGGTYCIRAGIIEADTGQPLALRGWQDPPLTLAVRANPSAFANLKMASQQLVSVDVDWSSA